MIADLSSTFDWPVHAGKTNTDMHTLVIVWGIVQILGQTITKIQCTGLCIHRIRYISWNIAADRCHLACVLTSTQSATDQSLP